MPAKATGITTKSAEALKMWNQDQGKGWQWGTNFDSREMIGDFQTFINKYLFPKISETTLAFQELGNRFDFLAREVDAISQFSEEYKILDSVPVGMNLSKNEEMVLKREYPKMATKLYREGDLKKLKFTLNNNDVRMNFSTLADATSYALGVYKQKINDINVSEEMLMKAMIVDYQDQVEEGRNLRRVTSQQDMVHATFEALLNLQNNSAKYNETAKASGGLNGRSTTQSRLEDILIVTDDKTKAYLLDTVVANTFQEAGLDISDHVISFDDMGGTWKITEDVVVNSDDTIAFFRSMGDYQIIKGDTLFKGDVIPYDISAVAELSGKIEEVKPKSDLFVAVLDINALRYRRNTKGMLKEPFYNGEFDEVTYWLHWYTSMAISPFYNKIYILGEDNK